MLLLTSVLYKLMFCTFIFAVLLLK